MIERDLLQAYNQTNYCFDDIVLTIDKTSEQAATLLHPFTPYGGIFITAWNSYGEKFSHTENKAANNCLKNDLLEKGLTVIDGYGESPDGKWREDSFFAYPIDEGTSLNLCNQYKQNAVVYVTSDGLPILILGSISN